jgi:phosphatidylglycerophosphate synthase
MNNFINLAGFLLALITGILYYWIAAVLIFFLFYLIRLPSFLSKFPLRIGYANWISFIRFIMILIGLVYWDAFTDWLLFGLFGGAILLDGADGYVARQFNQTSKAGEHFDMEIDAVFVFFLSYMHFQYQKLPIWILFPGSLRYVYGIVFFWLKQPEKIKPGKRFRSTVAVLFFISLLLPFIVKENLYIPFVMTSSVMVIVSFGISAYYILINHFSTDR